MTCDRKCGTSCPLFIPIDVRLIAFLEHTFPVEGGPVQGDGTCELDVRAKPRKSGDKCEFPEPEERINPED